MTDNLKGALLMTAAMAGFALEDMFIKMTAASHGPGVVILTVGVFGTLCFGALARLRGQSLYGAYVVSRPVFLRNLFEVLATVCFVTALARAPLSLSTAILQATPLVVTLGAMLFLGVQVGWRQWAAICCGLGGVLLILRPGSTGFDPNALWAIAAMIFLAGRDLATRAIPAHVCSMALAMWAMVVLIPTGLVMIGWGQDIPHFEKQDYLRLAGVVIAGLSGYYCIISAMRIGEVAVVTPFRYSRLLFGLVFAVVVFQETPDVYMLVGAAIVLATGLYTILRETRRSG